MEAKTIEAEDATKVNIQEKAQAITKDSNIEGAFINREDGNLSVTVSYDNGVAQGIYNGPDNFEQMADHQILQTLEGKSKQDAFRGFRKHVLFEGPANPTMYSPDMDIEDYHSVMDNYTNGDKPALTFTQHDITDVDLSGVRTAQEQGLSSVSSEHLKTIQQADELVKAQGIYESKVASLQKAEESLSIVSKAEYGIEDINTELGHRAQKLGDQIGQVFDVEDKKEAYKALRVEHGKPGAWKAITEDPEKFAPLSKEYKRSFWGEVMNKDNEKFKNAMGAIDKGFSKQRNGINKRKQLNKQLKGKKSVDFYKKKVKTLSKEVNKAEKSLRSAQKALNKSVEKTLQKGGKDAVKNVANQAKKVGAKGLLKNPSAMVAKAIHKVGKSLQQTIQQNVGAEH